jgi:hypothetical protein
MKFQPRLLITGSRTWTDVECIRYALHCYKVQFGKAVMLNGACRTGADLLCAQIGTQLGYEIECYPAQWDLHGKRAGMLRNIQMIEQGKPTHCMAFIANNSPGATHCKNEALKAKIPTKVFINEILQ